MCLGHQGDYWRRFVYAKKLMHVFDEPAEKAGDEKTFDQQIKRFRGPTVETSPQYRAEVKALWRGLGVLCPEGNRMELKAQFDDGSVSLGRRSAFPSATRES